MEITRLVKIRRRPLSSSIDEEIFNVAIAKTITVTFSLVVLPHDMFAVFRDQKTSFVLFSWEISIKLA